VLLKWPPTGLLQRFRIHKNLGIQKVNVQKWKVFRTKWWQLFPEFVWSSFNHALYVDYFSTFSAQTPWGVPWARVSGASSAQSGWPVTHRVSSIHGYAVSYIRNVQSHITVAFGAASHSPYSMSFLLRSHFCFTLSLPQCIHRSFFFLSFFLSCCELISATLSPYRSVYTGLSFLLRSHFCYTLSLPQCIHRSFFLVANSFLLHSLLTAVYTQVFLSCCDLISASPSPYRSVYTSLSFLLRSHFCFTLSLQQAFLVAISFLLHTLLTAVYTQVSPSCFGLLSISKTPLLLFFNSRQVLRVIMFLFSMTVHVIPNPETINQSMHMTAP